MMNLDSYSNSKSFIPIYVNRILSSSQNDDIGEIYNYSGTNNLKILTIGAEERENMVNDERDMNQKFYNQIKDELLEKHSGKYAVIANGRLQQIADSYEDVKNTAIDANHRFIFKIEAKPKTKRILRWPMTRKK